jgi:hypothetical protein
MNPDSTEQIDFPELPWEPLESLPEIEGWMALYNQELQELIGTKATRGHGICFQLKHGGELYMHTNSDGDILLDVTPEAEWITPLIGAATRREAPRGRVWMLPGDVMLQLIVGLNTLIASTRLVLRHEFRK